MLLQKFLNLLFCISLFLDKKPLRAKHFCLAGQIWPAGRMLPTLGLSHALAKKKIEHIKSVIVLKYFHRFIRQPAFTCILSQEVYDCTYYLFDCQNCQKVSTTFKYISTREYLEIYQPDIGVLCKRKEASLATNNECIPKFS